MMMPSTNRLGSDFFLRLCSGVVLAVVASTALIAGGGWFSALVCVAAGLMAFEWRNIGSGQPIGDKQSPLNQSVKRDLVSDYFFIALCLLCCGFAAFGLIGMVAPLILFGGAGIFWRDYRVGQRAKWQIIGLPIIVLSTVMLIWLRSLAGYGLSTCIWLLLVVAAADIGGYIFGRLVGGPKLAPRFSPKKTWAGFVGGVLFAGGVGVVFSALTTETWAHQVGLVSMIAAMIAPAGDIAESAYKRYYGVKDSGKCIPGHGGILDRVDGLIAATLVTGIVTFMRGQEIFVW